MVFETVNVPGAVILPISAHHLRRLWASAAHTSQAPLAEKFPDGRLNRPGNIGYAEFRITNIMPTTGLCRLRLLGRVSDLIREVLAGNWSA